MNSGEIIVSADTLIRIFVILLYVPVGWISYRLLIPRLSPSGKRMAIFMLVAQVLVIVVSLGIPSSSNFETWLWDLKWEWNIPSTFASTQLALVAGVALATAWLAKARPAGQRLYLVGTGLIFLFLAVDEYFTIHEYILNWERHYSALGAVLVIATTFVAARSPRRTWIWHICLLTGLAMSATGGILLEVLPSIRCNFGLLRLDKCLHSFHWEEFLEFLGIWLALVAVLGHFSQAMPTPKPRARRVLYALPALWVLLLLLNSLVPRLELRLLARPAAVEFESGVNLQGYRMDSRARSSFVRLFASATQRDYFGLGYSIHLIDQVSGSPSPAVTIWRIVSMDSGCSVPTLRPFIVSGWRSTSRRRPRSTARFGSC